MDLHIERVSGVVRGIRYVESPNCDDRPPDCPPDTIVIHNISLPPGEFGGDAVEYLFTNQLDPTAHSYFAEIVHLRVSAHILIKRNGDLIQFVPFHRRAWHSGLSCFQGRSRCNDFSIGLELEGADDVAYENVQYDVLVSLVSCLLFTYPTLSSNRIIGHEHIAPGRKTDPGPAFEWQYFRQRLETHDPGKRSQS